MSITDSNGETIVRMHNLWEWAFKLFLGTAPLVVGAAWVHLASMNAMLLQHDKEIALLKLQAALRVAVMPGAPGVTGVGKTAMEARPLQ